MATMTAKQPKTIEFFKARLEDFRNKHNRILEEARKKGYSEKKTYRLIRYNEIERELLMRDVHDAGLDVHVLDSTIYFQSGSGYEGNHELGDAMAKEFPQGVNDSESGQGFFYINTKYVPDVLKWLEGRVEIRQLRENEKKAALDALANGKASVSVNKSVSFGLK